VDQAEIENNSWGIISRLSEEQKLDIGVKKKLDRILKRYISGFSPNEALLMSDELVEPRERAVVERALAEAVPIQTPYSAATEAAESSEEGVGKYAKSETQPEPDSVHLENMDTESQETNKQAEDIAAVKEMVSDWEIATASDFTRYVDLLVEQQVDPHIALVALSDLVRDRDTSKNKVVSATLLKIGHRVAVKKYGADSKSE
jgi:hypothetical protein